MDFFIGEISDPFLKKVLDSCHAIRYIIHRTKQGIKPMSRTTLTCALAGNSKTIWCLIVDDCPIGTATCRDGIVSATVTYDNEIVYFNSDGSFYDMLSEILAYVQTVDQRYNDAADAAEHYAERNATRGTWFGRDDDGLMFDDSIYDSRVYYNQ